MPRRREVDEAVPTSLGDRLKQALLKPPPPGAAPATSPGPRSIDELEATANAADDKERLIGLLAAPIAAAIAILTVSALVANDPAPFLTNGAVNTSHVNPSTYYEVLAVLAGLSVLMLVFSMLRKRLYVGIAMALYGLAIFNLHYWGFGIPFVLCGAWYLVRAYRAQRDRKAARDESPPARNSGASRAAPPRSSKRYTPPPAARGRSSTRRSAS